MKLYSQALELLALRSIAVSGSVNKTPEAAAYLLGSMSDDFFYYEPASAALKRIRALARKHGEVPNYSELCEDPALDEDFRDVLREYEGVPIKSVRKAKRLFTKLDEYRKTRTLYTMCKSVIEDLTKPAVDVDALIESVSTTVTQARSSNQTDLQVSFIGPNANSCSSMRDSLTAEIETLLKTGFHELDERNGGMVAEGVHVIAATTSGGKSVVLQNLLYNLFKLNKVSVLNVSLEMTKPKLMRRIASMLTGIEFSKFVKRTATDEEIDAADEAWAKLHRFGEKHGCRFGLMCPVGSVTMEGVLATAKPYGFNVIGIDYAGLLEGMAGDDQWRALSECVRQAKIYSSATGSLVIILAQLDDATNKIRYSKGMLEHADSCWTWNYASPEVRDLKVIPVNQIKGRDAELFPFDLNEEFHIMRVTNPTTSDAVMDGDTRREKSRERDRHRDREYDDDDERKSRRSESAKRRRDGESDSRKDRRGKSKALVDDDLSFDDGSGV